MSVTCEIPYIDNASILDADKEIKKLLHLNSVKELLSFEGVNFKTLLRKLKSDGETYTVLYEPGGANQQRFEKYVEDSTYLKHTLKYRKLNGKNIIVIDTLEDSELSESFTNPLSTEAYLREGFTLENNNEDIATIIEDDDNRRILYDIINEQSDRIDLMILDPNLDTFIKDELKVIRRGMDDDNIIYSIESTTNFLKYAVNFADRYSKKFDKNGSDYLGQLERIENLPTFEERKTARAALSKKVDYIKNKFYIFGALNKIADQLSLNSLELNDVFEVYNRYSIQKKLEEIRTDQPFKDAVLKLISDKHANKLELKYAIENLDSGLTSSEIDTLLDSSVYKSMKDKEGNIKPTLLSSIKKAQDDLINIQNSTKQYFIDAQVNLLYDTYVTYLPQENTAFAKQYGVTKEKIKNSILQANGNIGLLDYGMKHGDQLPDEVISLFTTLLQSTVTEADFATYQEAARLTAKFSKEEYKGREKEFGEAMSTYTFELANKWQPQYYETLVENGETFLTYTVNTLVAGVITPEVKKFPLPKENVYDRYYKLSSSNDDNWAYKTDQGYYVRVQATKAIEGKNNSHRIDIEQSVLRDKINEIASSVYEGSDFIMYEEDGLIPTKISEYSSGNKPFKLSEKAIKMKIWEAFNDKYINKLSKFEALIKVNELYEGINIISEDKKEDIFKKNFRRKKFEDRKESFFKAAVNPQIAESTWLAALTIEEDATENKYLVQLKDGDIIPINVKVGIRDDFSTFYTVMYNGSPLPESKIEYIIEKGKSFESKVVDKIITNPDFNTKLKSDTAFASFYKDILEEYEKIEAEDSSGFLQHGKVGQVFSMDNKSFIEKIRDFSASDTKKADLAEASYQGLKKFLGAELTKDVPKTNKKGEYIDYNGDVLPPGAKPIMIPRSKLNVDRLSLDNLSPTFANRIYDQNLVTTNILANIMAMSGQAINFNKMYELEPQMRFALLLSQGSPDLNISPRQIENISKSKGRREYEKRIATQANKNLEFIIKAYGYDDPLIEDSLGRKTFSKLVEPIRKLTFFQEIALNVTAMIPNIVIGQTNNYLVAMSKKFGLDSKNVLDSQKQVTANLIPILAGTVGHVKLQDSHFIVKLATIFNSISGMALDPKSITETKTALEHYASLKTLYLTTSGAEVTNQMPLMLGYLKGMQLKGGGTMYEAVRIDGKKLEENPNLYGSVTLVNQDGSPVSEKEIVKATLELSKLNSEAQGDYGKNQKIRARYEFLPSLALTYAGWLYPNLRKRFGGGTKYDKMTGKEDFGGYQSTFMANSLGRWDDFKELFAFGNAESFSEFVERTQFKKIGSIVGRTLLEVPLVFLNAANSVSGQKLAKNDLIKKLLKIKDINSKEFKELFKLEKLTNESEEEFQKRVEEAYDFYITSLQTASREYTIILAFMLLGLMAKALSDDDDDGPTVTGKIAKFIDVRSKQIVSDMSLGAPLLSPLKPYDFFSQRSKDPLVILRTIERNSKLFLNLVGFQINPSQGEFNFNINDTYDKSGLGYEKGDLKIEHNLRKTLGPWNQFHRLLNPQEQESYLKLINKGEVITDKDLSEDKLEKEK